MTSAEEPVPPEISCRPCLSVSIRSEGKRGGTNDDWQSSIYRHGDGRDGLRFSHQVYPGGYRAQVLPRTLI